MESESGYVHNISLQGSRVVAQLEAAAPNVCAHGMHMRSGHLVIWCDLCRNNQIWTELVRQPWERADCIDFASSANALGIMVAALPDAVHPLSGIRLIVRCAMKIDPKERQLMSAAGAY